ncbi:hypothetical protein ABVK25_010637 [Lepraria finkii]|uniref:RRM domain-containing protein n=1 Tax=Lepraria finkii TaxID=1340010 RepID=A0ABR4AV22_9LECA
MWLCFRRAAIRVLSSSPSTLISIKSCSITSLTHPISISRTSNLQRTALFPLRRRYASDEAATQAEPEADGTTEAQHGDNSIAASADADANAPKSATQYEEASAQSTIESATESAKDQASSAASQVSDAAQSASETVTGAAESLGAAAGFGAGSSQAQPSLKGMQGAQEGEPSKTVYVGNLYFDVRSEDLKREFERAGQVVEAKIIMDQRGLSKGFGYVEFDSIDAATKAISLYNLQNFEGRRLSVQYSLSRQSRERPASRLMGRDAPSWSDRPRHPPTKTLFIGNMSFAMSDRDLTTLFREIKNVIDVRVAIDRRT